MKRNQSEQENRWNQDGNESIKVLSVGLEVRYEEWYLVLIILKGFSEFFG